MIGVPVRRSEGVGGYSLPGDAGRGKEWGEHDRQAASRGRTVLDADGDDEVMTKLRHEHGQVAVRAGWLSATGRHEGGGGEVERS